MSRARIVIIAEERETADWAAARLQKEGYDVEIVSEGQEGLQQVRALPPDLVILDVMLSDMSSTQVMKRLRKSQKTVKTPILLMTTHDEIASGNSGLEIGADDFVIKPVNPAELTARVAGLLHRLGRRQGEEHTFQIGPIYINMDRHEVAMDGEPLKLTLTEFRLLSSLAEADGRVLERNLLIDQAIGMDAIVTDRTIDVHLTSLRRKLGPARYCLKTVRGVGYRLADDETDAG